MADSETMGTKKIGALFQNLQIQKLDSQNKGFMSLLSRIYTVYVLVYDFA